MTSRAFLTIAVALATGWLVTSCGPAPTLREYPFPSSSPADSAPAVLSGSSPSPLPSPLPSPSAEPDAVVTSVPLAGEVLEDYKSMTGTWVGQRTELELSFLDNPHFEIGIDFALNEKTDVRHGEDVFRSRPLQKNARYRYWIIDGEVISLYAYCKRDKGRVRGEDGDEYYAPGEYRRGTGVLEISDPRDETCESRNFTLRVTRLAADSLLLDYSYKGALKYEENRRVHEVIHRAKLPR